MIDHYHREALPLLDGQASLDPPETKPQSGRSPCSDHAGSPRADYLEDLLAAPSAEIAFRHSGWAPTRRKVLRALDSLPDGAARFARVATCGSRAWVYKSVEPVPRYAIRCRKCHDRFCTPCATARSHQVARNLARVVDPKHTRFVTLTLKHSDAPLADQLTRLYASFAKLRSRKLWRSTQNGGIAFLEVKRSRDGRSWHPHLHVLTTGRFLPQTQLAAAWLSVTGDSHIVDIRWIRRAGDACDYVAKYAAKGCCGTVIADPPALREAVAALAGRRTYLTYGTWRGKVMSAPEDDDGVEWVLVSTLESLLASRRLAGDRAGVILACLSAQAGEIIAADLPPPADTIPPLDSPTP